MKFLKTKNISKYSISDMTLLANTYGRVVLNSTSGLMVPKGTTAQRPQISGVRQPTDANGTIRYNTSTNPITGRPFGLEAYIDGNWEIVRAPGANTITKQTLGPGDDAETIFGPLTIIPSADDNILVFVENVFQISVTNYNILYNYLGSGDAHIEFTSSVPLDKYITIYYGFSN